MIVQSDRISTVLIADLLAPDRLDGILTALENEVHSVDLAAMPTPRARALGLKHRTDVVAGLMIKVLEDALLRHPDAKAAVVRSSQEILRRMSALREWIESELPRSRRFMHDILSNSINIAIAIDSLAEFVQAIPGMTTLSVEDVDRMVGDFVYQEALDEPYYDERTHQLFYRGVFELMRLRADLVANEDRTIVNIVQRMDRDREARNALRELGLDTDHAASIVFAIRRRAIPHVQMK